MSVILADCGESVKWTVHGEQPTPISTLLGETWLCVDAKEDSGQVGGDPYGREKEAQTWECAQENPNQLWTIQELGQPAEWNNSDAGADAPDGTENHEEIESYDLTESQDQTDGNGHE
ncbi:hypothetical protein I316_07820 [Kwoniella heveanensis BCC8398]|uniref:Uncharacterized protein n=1 Tax=Kwoniella heveanensis BCC8398 TaxID=1296120 RepID=A0A1B9GHL9_9TREE|nr:hypothetical protein I316_07820 [Kwoniella heveanensis BCC8398]